MSRLTESLKDIKNDPPTPVKLTPEEWEVHKKTIEKACNMAREWIASVSGNQK